MAAPFSPEMNQTHRRVPGWVQTLGLFAVLVAGWEFRDVVVWAATVLTVVWLLAILFVMVAGLVAGLGLLVWALWDEFAKEMER